MGIEESLKSIEEVLKRLDQKIDNIAFRLEVLEAQKGSPNPAAVGGRSVAAAVESSKPEEKSEPRSKCPKCGGTAYQEKEDKSKPMSHSGGFTIYAKVRYCKSCGTEFKS